MQGKEVFLHVWGMAGVDEVELFVTVFVGGFGDQQLSGRIADVVVFCHVFQGLAVED